jgi:hypothetical protein
VPPTPAATPTGTPLATPTEALPTSTPIATPTPCNDLDGDTICDDVDPDTDGDHCPNAKELGPNPGQGGQRDPLNPWDYFNPTLDGLNRTDDIAIEVTHYGHDDNGDPLYSTRFDRTALMGGHPWQFGPPNGTLRTADITAAVLSYGHDCS